MAGTRRVRIASVGVAVLCVAGVAASAAASASAEALVVRQWDRFEIVVANPRGYRDPYRDVSLDASFTAPDGRRRDFWGFYDGAQTWRLRFMPDQEGTWRYTAAFSDGAAKVEGTFQCIRSNLPGMLAVHRGNPVWFGHSGGDAILVRGLHIGDRFLARNWDDPANPADGEKRTVFLDWAQRQGYNLLSIASHYLNRNAPGRGADWDTPRLWPLDAAEYRRLETILDDLARRGMSVFPFAGLFGRDARFPRDPAEQTAYVRYSYARLGACRNVLLNVAGPEPLLRGKPFFTRPELARIGTEIQRVNIFGHPLSVHNRTGADEFRDEAWTTFGTLQGPKTTDRVRLSRGLRESHHPAKPLLAQETLWSGNVNHIRANQRDYTDEELRKNTFVIHFSAAALVFADNDGDSSTGFSGTLDLKDCRQDRHDVIRRAWEVCATLPFGRLRPRQDLVGGEHAFCLADPGKFYAVYLDRSAPVSVDLGDGVKNGRGFGVTWIDARAADRRQLAGPTRDGRNLVPPAGGDDWVLVLESP